MQQLKSFSGLTPISSRAKAANFMFSIIEVRGVVQDAAEFCSGEILSVIDLPEPPSGRSFDGLVSAPSLGNIDDDPDLELGAPASSSVLTLTRSL